MRSTQGSDGKRRIVDKVAVPMGVTEITMFALANPQFHNQSDSMNQFENLNKRQMFNVAKDSVAKLGADLPSAVVSDNWTDRQISRAIDHVSGLFPEVDK